MTYMVAVRAAALTLVLAAPVLTGLPSAHAEAAPGGRGAQESEQEKRDRLRTVVYPSFARAPAVVTIQALIAREEGNRQLEFAAESGAYFRSSTIELSGADAARVHVVQFRSIPAGDYTVRVVLRGETGDVRATSHARLIIAE